jgi:hypothetical protein
MNSSKREGWKGGKVEEWKSGTVEQWKSGTVEWNNGMLRWKKCL